METLRAKRAQPGITDDLAILGIFLVAGLLSGFLFAWLTNRPSLQQFFFIKYDKFTVPRYSYWFTFSLLHILGLTSAYGYCKSRGWIAQTVGVLITALVMLIFGLAAPFARLTVLTVGDRLDLGSGYIIGILIFLTMISIAMSILSRNLKLFPVSILWNALFVAAGVLYSSAAIRITSIGKERADFLLWPILFATIDLSLGNWLIWRRKPQAE